MYNVTNIVYFYWRFEMYNIRNITDDLIYIGVNDRRLTLFENVFPIPNGISYNSYLLKDEKNVLLDTVDVSTSKYFFENLTYALAGENLDYLIINHMEPDHAGIIQELKNKYPNLIIVCNMKSQNMLKQFFDFDIENSLMLIKEGDILNIGKHTLTFIMAPMVHWPETMITYDLKDKILFSADAFGTFGALNGNIYADEIYFEKDWLDEARRYYSNIVGKYGMQVQALLKKTTSIDIKLLCPLHGPIWRDKIDWFINKYQKWSLYEPEENSILIIYGSVYGHTENVAEILANRLASKKIKNIKMYDVSKIHFSFLVSEAFRCSHIIVASTTYNAGIFCNMETVLQDFKTHNLQNRKIAIVENGTWAPSAACQIRKIFDEMKNIEFIEPVLTIKSALKKEQLDALEILTENILVSINN